MTSFLINNVEDKTRTERKVKNSFLRATTATRVYTKVRYIDRRDVIKHEVHPGSERTYPRHLSPRIQSGVESVDVLKCRYVEPEEPRNIRPYRPVTAPSYREISDYYKRTSGMVENPSDSEEEEIDQQLYEIEQDSDLDEDMRWKAIKAQNPSSGAKMIFLKDLGMKSAILDNLDKEILKELKRVKSAKGGRAKSHHKSKGTTNLRGGVFGNKELVGGPADGGSDAENSDNENKENEYNNGYNSIPESDPESKENYDGKTKLGLQKLGLKTNIDNNMIQISFEKGGMIIDIDSSQCVMKKNQKIILTQDNDGDEDGFRDSLSDSMNNSVPQFGNPMTTSSMFGGGVGGMSGSFNHSLTSQNSSLMNQSFSAGNFPMTPQGGGERGEKQLLRRKPSLAKLSVEANSPPSAGKSKEQGLRKGNSASSTLFIGSNGGGNGGTTPTGKDFVPYAQRQKHNPTMSPNTKVYYGMTRKSAGHITGNTAGTICGGLIHGEQMSYSYDPPNILGKDRGQTYYQVQKAVGGISLTHEDKKNSMGVPHAFDERQKAVKDVEAKKKAITIRDLKLLRKSFSRGQSLTNIDDLSRPGGPPLRNTGVTPGASPKNFTQQQSNTMDGVIGNSSPSTKGIGGHKRNLSRSGTFVNNMNEVSLEELKENKYMTPSSVYQNRKSVLDQASSGQFNLQNQILTHKSTNSGGRSDQGSPSMPGSAVESRTNSRQRMHGGSLPSSEFIKQQSMMNLGGTSPIPGVRNPGDKSHARTPSDRSRSPSKDNNHKSLSRAGSKDNNSRPYDHRMATSRAISGKSPSHYTPPTPTNAPKGIMKRGTQEELAESSSASDGEAEPRDNNYNASGLFSPPPSGSPKKVTTPGKDRMSIINQKNLLGRVPSPMMSANDEPSGTEFSFNPKKYSVNSPNLSVSKGLENYVTHPSIPGAASPPLSRTKLLSPSPRYQDEITRLSRVSGGISVSLSQCTKQTRESQFSKATGQYKSASRNLSIHTNSGDELINNTMRNRMLGTPMGGSPNFSSPYGRGRSGHSREPSGSGLLGGPTTPANTKKRPKTAEISIKTSRQTQLTMLLTDIDKRRPKTGKGVRSSKSEIFEYECEDDDDPHNGKCGDAKRAFLSKKKTESFLEFTKESEKQRKQEKLVNKPHNRKRSPGEVFARHYGEGREGTRSKKLSLSSSSPMSTISVGGHGGGYGQSRSLVFDESAIGSSGKSPTSTGKSHIHFPDGGGLETDTIRANTHTELNLDLLNQLTIELRNILPEHYCQKLKLDRHGFDFWRWFHPGEKFNFEKRRYKRPKTAIEKILGDPPGVEMHTSKPLWVNSTQDPIASCVPISCDCLEGPTCLPKTLHEACPTWRPADRRRRVYMPREFANC